MSSRKLRSPAMLLAALAVSVPLSTAAESASGGESARGPIEEIVVTARKRTETLQETPVAVTALTADQMAEFGVQSLADISKMTAGLLFDSGIRARLQPPGDPGPGQHPRRLRRLLFH